MLVDAHCHLDYDSFDEDRDEVVARAEDVVIVNSIVSPDAFGKGIALSKRYPNVHCTLGLAASDLDEGRYGETVRLIREHAQDVVGLGEVGLDYYWVKDGKGRDAEQRRFRGFIELAQELGLPLIVHSRDAEADCINILEELKTSAIMHCFSGTISEAEQALDLGCLISVPANVTHSKSRQELAASLPLKSLVLETDSPYLSPVKGQRNEPGNVKYAAEKIAQLKGVEVEEVAAATTRNALSFFGIRNG